MKTETLNVVRKRVDGIPHAGRTYCLVLDMDPCDEVPDFRLFRVEYADDGTAESGPRLSADLVEVETEVQDLVLLARCFDDPVAHAEDLVRHLVEDGVPYARHLAASEDDELLPSFFARLDLGEERESTLDQLERLYLSLEDFAPLIPGAARVHRFVGEALARSVGG